MRLFILDMSPQTPDLQPSNYVFILVRLDGAYLFVFESILLMKLSDAYEVLSASLAIWAAVHAERIVLQ